MKHSRLLIAILLLVLVLPPYSAHAGMQAGVQTGWQPLAPGIDFQKFSVAGPNEVFVVRMDRSNPSATVDTSLANAKLNNQTLVNGQQFNDWEPILDQSQRYDGALSFWGRQWGSRNKVVAAVNGDYHDTLGMPMQGQILSGWYAKRFEDGESTSGFVWTQDREAFIGGCVRHDAALQQFYLQNDLTRDKNIQRVNVLPDDRPANSFILYTSQFDNFTPQLDGIYEVLIEMTGPTQLISKPDRVVGIVRETGQDGGMMIPFNHVVISATGDKIPALKTLVIGDSVGISQQVSPGCQITDPTFDWSDAYSGIGGDFRFLRNGVLYPYSDNGGATHRQPRTAIAFNAAYLYLIVVDGYHGGVSLGMNIAELGNFAIQYLQATEAISLDSGTSSTMVVNGQVINNTLCNANWNGAIAGCNYKPAGTQLEEPGAVNPVPEGVQAADLGNPSLVNGIMMVSVQPAEFSSSHAPGEVLTTQEMTALRLGPGSNYARVLTVPAGAQVTVLEQFNNLNGVLAKGGYWWKVRYDSPTYGTKEGWIVLSDSGFTATDWSYLPLMRR